MNTGGFIMDLKAEICTGAREQYVEYDKTMRAFSA